MTILRKDLAPGTVFRYLCPTPGFEEQPTDVRVVDTEHTNDSVGPGTLKHPRPSPGRGWRLAGGDEPVAVFLDEPEQANDAVPVDELLLAEMLAETHSRNLGWCSAQTVRYTKDPDTEERVMTHCCALGALALVRGAEPTTGYTVARTMDLSAIAIYSGNDHSDSIWTFPTQWDEEALGYAFRQAMTVD